MEVLINAIIFILLAAFTYIVMNSFMPKPVVESLANMKVGSETGTYADSIKAAANKKHDAFIIEKYRTDYERAIDGAALLVDNLMLETALSIDDTNPMDAVIKLNELYKSKEALNAVMKFVDSK